MTRSSRAGENENFCDYYEQDSLLDGCINETEYQIYRIRDTHYSIYIHLPDVCVCMIETGALPPAPVRESINFGPTEDGWVGFTTNGVTEYNYDAEMNVLPDDRREEPNSYTYFAYEDINRWTPRLLESAVTDWIIQTNTELTNVEMQCSHD